MSEAFVAEVLELTDRLLQSIAGRDWKTYNSLCDPSISCFEPEACGQLVEGMDFHKFYFDLEKKGGPRNTTIVAPHVRLLGEAAAIVCYVRLTQYVDGSGTPHTNRSEETRVWQRQGGTWKHVHFHRSANG